MSKLGNPRFDPKTLRQMAGDKAYTRGEGYAGGGQVRILSLCGNRVIAEAYGTDHYGLCLRGAGKVISGSCTCPAFDDAGFCKHLVAAGLVSNALFNEGAEPDDAIDKITEHLAKMSKTDLVAHLLAMAETMPALLHQLAYDADVELREEDEW